MKKISYISIVMILLVAAVLSAFSFAQEGNDVLTLDEAIESALTNSRTVKIEDINLDQAELDENEMKINAKDIPLNRLKMFAGKSTVANAEVQKEVGYLRADYSLEVAKDKRELVDNQIKLQVKKSYYQVVEIENMIKLANDNLKYMEKQMETVKLNKDLGNATNLDVLSMEIQLESVKSQLEQLENSKLTAVMGLNTTVGLPLDNRTIVEANLQQAEFELDLVESIDKALVSRMDVKGAEKDLEFKKRELEIFKHYLPSGKYDRDSAENTYAIAQINVESLKDGVRIEITNKYNNVLNVKNQLDVSNLKVQKAQEEAKIAQLKYDTQLITLMDLTQAQNNLTNAKIDQISTIHSYNNAVEEFVYAVNYGN